MRGTEIAERGVERFEYVQRLAAGAAGDEGEWAALVVVVGAIQLQAIK